MHLSNEIEAMWEMMPNEGPARERFPWVVVRNSNEYAPMAIGCTSEQDAKNVLLSIALRADNLGQRVKLV